MGFDLNGLNATSERGEYFRNNNWYWRPLANYVVDHCAVDPEDVWFYNSGHTVPAEQARAIADTLDSLLASGQVRAFAAEYARLLAKLPDEQCDLCLGSGVRADETAQGTCNVCRGHGTVSAFARNYPFSVENVREFADFCRHSGGFTIN